MYNNYQHNTQQYGTWLVPTSAVYDLLEFDNFSFDSWSVRISELPTIEDVNGIEYQTYNVANDHWQGVYGWNIRNKRIQIEVLLKWDTAEELESNLTSMKSKVIQKEKRLTYRRIDGRVLWTDASCTSFVTNRKYYQTTFIPNIKIERETADPFFYDLSVTQESYEWITSNQASTVNYIEWSMRATPIILVNFNTASTVTEAEFTIWDRTITINDTFEAWDDLLIDCKTKSVSKNGTIGQDYSGQFPILEVWSNQFDVTIDGTWNTDVYIIRYGTYV